jgi:hypothetical protein
MNYGDLRTKFKARLNRRDCTDALADGFLQDAITRVQRTIRIPSMERSVSITISDDNYITDMLLDIPTDYLMLRDMSVTLDDDSKARLRRMPLAFVEERIGLSGIPQFFARKGVGFVLAPTPLSGRVINIDYYSEFPAAEEVADENSLTLTASDLVLFGALSYAADHWSDQRGPQFEQRFTQILSDIKLMADDDELSNAQVEPAFAYED